MTPEQSSALRAAFPASAVGKLPKAGITLDYIGHATVTDRLLSVDPEWSWEPMAVADDGGPLIRHGAKELTMWIRLTVGGVSRLGVGSVAPNAFDVEKQLVGDAIRNAAMRFGVALDLWSKAELESAHFDAEAAKVRRSAPVACPVDGCTAKAPSKAAHIPHLVNVHGWTESGGKVRPPTTTTDTSSTAAPPAADDDGHDLSAGVGTPPGGAPVPEAEGVAPASPSLGSTGAAPSPMTDPQRRRLMPLLAERGLADREDRLGWAALELGRPVASFSSLTRAEAGALIEAAEALTPEGMTLG